MTQVAILGANGRIAQWVVRTLQDEDDVQLTLFVRHAGNLADFDQRRVRVVVGDANNEAQLREAIAGQDVVYANLAGDLDKQAEHIVHVMDAEGVSRLIFVTALGIYHEIPGAFGAWNEQMIGSSLRIYAKAAQVIEQSDLNYTIVRPAWLTDADEIDYELTRKGEPFRGTVVSRKSAAAYIVSVINNPALDERASMGIDKPGSDGDRPMM